MLIRNIRLPDEIKPEDNPGGGGPSLAEKIGATSVEDLDVEDFSEEEINLLSEEGMPAASEEERAAEEQAAKAAEEAKPGEGEHPAGYVPLAALQETRAELKRIRDANAEMNNKFAQIAEKLAEQRAQREEPKEEAKEQEPDFATDPLGAMEFWKNRFKQLEEGLQADKTAATEEQQRQQEDVQRFNYVVDTADQVMTQAFEGHDHLKEAYEFAVGAVRADLEAKGLRGQDFDKAFNSLLFQYAYNAPNDPAAMRTYIERNARYWGWDPNARKAAAGEERKPPAREVIDNLRKGQRAAASLSGGGGNNGGELNLGDLADMTGEELEALYEKNPELFDAAQARG